MRAPEFWNIRSGREAAPILRTLLKPISWVYAWASARRIRTTKSYDAGIPVICVGNVTLGGTGKTPVAAYLLHSLRRMGVNVVGLSRGYGGQEKGPIPVQRHHTAKHVGDEPLLLARKAPVWVSAGRDDGARAAVSYGAEVIVMDDGHQNPTLQKTLSLIVVDAEVGFGNGCVFPAGPLRERLPASLERTDAIILMKPDPTYEISDHLAAQLKDQTIIPAFLKTPTKAPQGKLFAFAGIGRPNKFFDSLRRRGGELVEALSYDDHHPYNDQDIQRLQTLSKEYDAQLITTEKDYIRLPKAFRKKVKVWPVEVQFEDELTLRALLHPIIQSSGAQYSSGLDKK